MSRVVKVAISLPAEVLEAIESERETRGETRSEFLRQAVESFIHQVRERKAIDRYVQGYKEQPESEEEVTVVHALGASVIAQEPWE